MDRITGTEMDHSSSNTNPTAGLLTKNRRKNFWEPIFTKEKLEPFTEFNWNFDTVTGIRRQTCSADGLEKLGSRKVIKNFTFSECDFFGKFSSPKLTFKECNFEKCDLGRCTWLDIKFQNCSFNRTSLTQSTFESCQFLDCKWSEIGLSGNETHIKECLITNPGDLIRSGYTNLDLEELEKNNTDPSYQTMRLEQSKLKIARVVLASLERIGDDASYYDAVKTYLNQSLIASISKAKLDFKHKKKRFVNSIRFAFLHIERLILNASGSINDWGASIAKPAFFGIGIVIFFGFYYRLFGTKENFLQGFIASFDVTTLVGYTKHASKDCNLFDQLSYIANVLLGLWWYAIFVPTVINRISRVRA